MEVTGLSLGVVAEARTLAQSVIGRIENFRQGRKSFEGLSENLDHLAQNIEEVDRLLLKFPHVLPADISPFFYGTLDRVRKSLGDADAKMIKEVSKAFAGSSTGFLGLLRSRAHRAFRATALRLTMDDVEKQIQEASNLLFQLAPVLANALINREHHDALVPMLGKLNFGEYCSATTAPAVSHTINLDFESKCAEGKFATPEGTLKNKILSSESSTNLTAAAGVLNPAYGVVGMAGVGKTIALQGLAYDKDIICRFPDGVQYLSFGQSATLRTAIGEIGRVMKLTGAVTKIPTAENCSSLRDAVDFAVAWFRSRVCLFLLDDLWPTESCTTGFLTELRQLVRESPDSRMAISTRSTAIAHEAGSVVDFGARSPLGSVSLNIFTSYALNASPSDIAPLDHGEIRPSVSRILSWCGGLPIALAVTGSAVALLRKSCRSFEHACDVYVTDFEEGCAILGAEKFPGGKRLSAGILLSLKYLQTVFGNWKNDNSLGWLQYSIRDLYTSLCVLKSQAWVPVAVLGRMWNLEKKLASDIVNLFSGMSMASISYRKVGDSGLEQAGLVLHDLHLEFCKREAALTNSESLWHSKLLNSYVETSSGVEETHHAPCTTDLSDDLLVSVKPRQWWPDRIPDDGYIHANVARHLFAAGHGTELAALLLDARWTIARGEMDGILGLKADFDHLDKFLQMCHETEEGRNDFNRISHCFKVILKTVQLSWGRFTSGLRAFQFQLCSRLHYLRKDHILICSYLDSFVMLTPKPYLLPLNQFCPHSSSAQELEIPVGGWCGGVTCSPCGRYIAVGAGHDIFVADALTGDILKRLVGHSAAVWCITFAAGSKKLFSGSEDCTVYIWDWQSPKSNPQVLRGHRGWITGVAGSCDGMRVFSGSHDCTFRIWDAVTGEQIGEILCDSCIECVAVQADKEKVALGLEDGTLKVLDCSTWSVVFENKDAHSRDITSASFSPDGFYLATSSGDRTVRVWNTEFWKEMGDPVEVHGRWITSIAFSPDGKKIASSSNDGTVVLWDFRIEGRSALFKKAVFRALYVKSVAFTNDGKRIISGSDAFVRMWDAQSDIEVNSRGPGHEKYALGVAINQDGTRVISGSGDKTLRLWDTHSGAHVETSVQGHISDVNCVTFGPDGRLVVSGSDDNTLLLWDSQTLEHVGKAFIGHTDVVKCVSFSCDGLRVISGSRDKTIRIWNAQTQEETGAPLTGHSSLVKSVSETPNGSFVVSRALNKETIIWNRIDRVRIWQSNSLECDPAQAVTDEEAEVIIRSCGQNAPHLWPPSFPEYTAAAFCTSEGLYSNMLGEKTLLGNFSSFVMDWKYHEKRKLFVAGLSTGEVALCRVEDSCE